MFSHGLLQRYKLAKQIIMSDKSLQRFSVFVSATETILRDQTELINYKAKSTKYECASVFLSLLHGMQIAFQ
jgi:hypothetical protein